jgi:ubiquinone/menaquinone biosynthesis C-methylase UbiE
MDATNLSIKTGTYDVVFDKSTIDCLMCALDRPKILTSKMLKESQRVLKTGGIYMAVSFGPPTQRAYLLK